jgi:tetratricopeptide (TPR) repeat protein
MLDTKQQTRLTLAVCVIALVCGLAAFWWLCTRDPKIDYLPEYPGAQWVIYPHPPVARVHIIADLSTEFRRSVALKAAPAKATISVRALHRFQLAINGQPVPPPSTSPSNWKTATEFDVTRLLHAGTNDISVTAINEKGPPALWFLLDADSLQVGSDTEWDASLMDAVWRKAWPASLPLPLEKGCTLFGTESTVASLAGQWPTQVFFAFISLIVFIVGSRAIQQYRALGEPRGPLDSPRFAAGAVLIMAALWGILFLNNLRSLPIDTGYDSITHLDYIDYIRTHRALPLATDGWEMCQPPLYYILTAVILSILHTPTTGDLAINALRIFGLMIGVAHFTFVFLGARALFPKQLIKQLFCLLFAALVPEQIFLAHYVTNEFLAATLVTGSIYFCLRLLKNDNASILNSVAIGLCLGGGLSTKATAVVAVPFVFGAIAFWLLLKHRADLGIWFRTLGVAAIVTIVAGGGHYLRVWKHFGKPLVHDWDPVSGFAWWTDAGYRTRSSAFGFGESLSHPFYSSLHSFADGIYSTLWGDGLLGGDMAIETRPPWNYELMAGGYLLALVPTALILAGIVICAVRFIRRPQPASFMLLGILFATFGALLYMNLKLPYYCNAKAFYALITLLPMCAAGAVGCDSLWQKARVARPVLSILLGVWALNAFSSYWIVRDARTHAVNGIHYCPMKRIPEAYAELSYAEQLDPHELAGRRILAKVMVSRGHPDEGLQKAQQLVAEYPDDAANYLALADLLDGRGQTEAACENAQKAIALAPGLVDARVKLCQWLSDLRKYQETVTACREALRLAPDRADLHFTLAAACDNLGDYDTEMKHYRFGCALAPKLPEGHDQFGVALAAQRQWKEAAEQFSIASQLRPEQADFRLHFGIALESGGAPIAAVQAYREALSLNPDFVAALNRLAWLRATHPDEHLRNGNEAIELAERACKLSGNKTPKFLNTLAAAYAEAGRYSDAIGTAEKAAKLAESSSDKDLIATLQKSLELYRANRPFRQ